MSKKSNNTNVWDVFVTFFFMTFLLIMFAGTAYLVEECDWSRWTFLIALIFIPSIRTGFSSNKDEEELSEKLELLVEAAQHLRDAQKMYMDDRGNDTKGKAVAEAATRLDVVLETI